MARTDGLRDRETGRHLHDILQTTTRENIAKARRHGCILRRAVKVRSVGRWVGRYALDIQKALLNPIFPGLGGTYAHRYVLFLTDSLYCVRNNMNYE